MLRWILKSGYQVRTVHIKYKNKILKNLKINQCKSIIKYQKFNNLKILKKKKRNKNKLKKNLTTLSAIILK